MPVGASLAGALQRAPTAFVPLQKILLLRQVGSLLRALEGRGQPSPYLT
jgi:hypothetical protein